MEENRADVRERKIVRPDRTPVRPASTEPRTGRDIFTPPMNTSLPSNRSFGWTFAVLFAAAGAYGLWRGGAHTSWVLVLAAVTALVTLAKPDLLAPLNRLWMKLGELLHRVVSPVVLGVIFYGVFTPAAFVMRIAGRDTMKRKFEPSAPTYWIGRNPPGPAVDSFRDQF